MSRSVSPSGPGHSAKPEPVVSALRASVPNALPNPFATRIQNCVATMLLHGNTRHSVNLKTLAYHNGWTVDDLIDEFARQEKAALSKAAPNAIDDNGEGK